THVHQRRHRRRLTAFELEHFGVLRLDAEVERELAVARSEEIAQDRAEGSPAPQRLIGLTYERYVREGEERLAVFAMGRTDEPPLLHVAQVVVAHVLVALE